MSNINLRVAVFLVLPQALLFSGGCETTFHEQLTKKLSIERPLDKTLPGALSASADSLDAFYVLGGNQDDLKLKIKEVGRLYKVGGVRKIFFLDRPGITEFSPKLGRNYTNNEWATEHLKQEGVEDGNLEFVAASSAFFSTFDEALIISSLARSRGLRRLILVTSQHHTERTWRSFSHCNRSGDGRLDLYIYGVKTEAGTYELLVELFKLSIYRLVVFPFDRLGVRF